ncbi:F-box domain-containing protein [Mycena kentingensis (nom. inval.)]|nr:F-box domain-containing protein [Mycena kentingensis (nom. inval.)]
MQKPTSHATIPRLRFSPRPTARPRQHQRQRIRPQMSTLAEEITPGDIVAVTHNQVRREGIAIGSHIDYSGRQILEVQMDAGEVYNAWYPSVTRVRRTVSYVRPSYSYSPSRGRTIERRVYW